MAALPESPDLRVVDLRHITTQELSALLAEESSTWRNKLHWDIRPSVELVERYVRMQALTGFALLHGAQVIGYLYFVQEDHKAIVGDLYVLEKQRTQTAENVLLQSAIEALRMAPGLRRIEAQFLLSHARSPGPSFPAFDHMRSHPRLFMEIDAEAINFLKPRPPRRAVLQPWSSANQDASAMLITRAYRDHIDSQINDQYQSTGGARRFLTNIVQYPGCGVFFAPGSLVALEEGTGALCGLVLASMVAPDAGHITQVCLAGSFRGTGLGYELMRRALVSMANHGAHTVSLTVTSANHSAIQLYEEMGLRVKREFPAYVWDFR